MSIADKLSRLQTAKEDIVSAITAKGGTVGATDGFEDFPAAVGTIPSGGEPLKIIYNGTSNPSWTYTEFEQDVIVEVLNAQYFGANYGGFYESNFNGHNLSIYAENSKPNGGLLRSAKNINNLYVKMSDETDNLNFAFYCTASNITIDFDTSNVREWDNAFGSIDYVLGEPLNFSSFEQGNPFGGSYSGIYLKEIRFVPNTIKNNFSFRISSAGYKSDYRSDDTFISLANGLDINNPGVLSIAHAITTQRINDITGTIDSDFLFAKDEAGTISLEDFILDVKGWTIA